MKPVNPPWSERLSKSLPNRDGLSAHPWLRPMATRLLDPQLWRLQHESVARGVAVGTFWAFVIPVAQIVVATVHCTWWRANIPVAAAMTMMTNPLTIGFWLWLAYQLGVLVLGEPLGAAGAAGVATGSISVSVPRRLRARAIRVLGSGALAAFSRAVTHCVKS